MADGGRADTITQLERAARMLAASAGTGSILRAHVDQIGKAPDQHRGEVVAIAWRGTREESAARSIGNGTRAPALRTWTRASGVAALPSFRADLDVTAALAGMEAVPAALLRVYALEAWHEWPTVEHAAVGVITGKGAREAVCDGMGRILWRVAAVSQDDRARQLRMRAARYRTMTRDAERLLLRWLNRAAAQCLDRLGNGAGVDMRSGSSPCAFKAETWWHPERPFRDGFTHRPAA